MSDAPSKYKYVCDGCGQIAWAKSTAGILCKFCRRIMQREEAG